MRGGEEISLKMIEENLVDDSMNSSVALMIACFDSKGNISSPYKIIETDSSFERFDKQTV